MSVCDALTLYRDAMIEAESIDAWLGHIFADPCMVAIPVDAQIGGVWYPCQLMRVPYPSRHQDMYPNLNKSYWVLLGIASSKQNGVQIKERFWVFAGQAERLFDLCMHLK